MEKFSDVTYKIKEKPESGNITVHVDHLKPYLGTVPLVWSVNSETENEGDITFETPELNLNISEPEIGLMDDSVEATSFAQNQTPSPRKTRCGRAIHKPNKYSP